ncbi:hypothetical protein TSUD_251450 [Trifolium subterraneum]|uniref:Uncharacterized protein n=1 Tax=Trifolium subterraneum TaxID=3900 RepID=A0A2Z6LRF8_TRISU|nr:hypothetical protein TSUD_251450 [Trifolium subterraneum]
MNEPCLWAGDFNDILMLGNIIYERLDRALSNDFWRVEFPDGFVNNTKSNLFKCGAHSLDSSASKIGEIEHGWIFVERVVILVVEESS